MQGAFVHHGLDFRTSRRDDEPSAETIRALVCDVLGELRTDDGDGANFHGEKRKNDAHSSTGLVISRCLRKAHSAGDKAVPHGPATMENRPGPTCSLSPTVPPSVVPWRGH
jgi:hypothetical protein